MTGTEIYKRTETYEKEALTIRLHAPQWKLLLAYDGQRSLAEVALSVDVPFVEALPLTERFIASKWIEEQPITLDQYLKRAGASNISAIGSAVPPVVVLHAPKPETPASIAPAPEAPAEKPPAVVNPPEASSKTGLMRLSAVINFILAAAGDRTLGQLLVYRVFLRVSPELLQRDEIASLQLAHDPGIARDPSLKQAIADAVSAIVKRPLPDTVFSPA